VWFQSVNGTPNTDRTVNKIPSNLKIPRFAGQVGEAFVGDR
jgi:hypothetical protein